MSFRRPLVALLPLIFVCFSVESAQSRSGGDLGVCSVEVEGDSLTMPVRAPVELGANGESICKRFFMDIADALESRQPADKISARGGAGVSTEDPINLGLDSTDRNWMNPVLVHFRGAAQGGRYRDFVLISRPNDRFVVQVSVRLADGSMVARYYEFSDWVTPQLK